MESDGTILDIDPFTIFGLFNKGITNDNRKLILGGIAKEFEIAEDIPSDFDGILTDEYLEDLNNLRDMPNGKQYCELSHTVSEILKNGENDYKNFPEFSLAAWTTTKRKKENTPVEEASDSTYWPSLEEYNPNISADEWVLFLQEDKKTYPSTLEMLKAMLELGGEATCKRVAELLGEHKSDTTMHIKSVASLSMMSST